jgi:acetylornithine/succinyldiaminopimelate/putrescine aminotransferase
MTQTAQLETETEALLARATFLFTDIVGSTEMLTMLGERVWLRALREHNASDVVAKAFDAGLLLNAPKEHTLRFMPSLVVSHDEIDQMTDILDRVLAA